MISLRHFFLLLALFTIALGQNEADDIGHEEELNRVEPRIIIHEVNLNKAFDEALPKIRHLIMKKGFDPVDIPDMVLPLGPLPGLLKTKMILHHGYMQGLSTIYRTGDITLQYSKKRISLYMNIGFEKLDLSHEYSMRYLLLTRRGDCYGRYDNVEAKMLVDFDFWDYQIDLKFFEFTNVGDFKLRLEGHWTDGLLNIVSEVVTKLFRTQVLRTIEAKAYNEIDKAVQEINEMIPRPCKAENLC